MSGQPYRWALADSFLGRTEELALLQEWWDSAERMPINLYGRRRVGKSWLFRRFAQTKPTILLVAHRVPAGSQLTSFADRLEPLLGVRPDLPDVPTLFRVLLRAARERKLLAVVDEFPWLLPGTEAADATVLSAVQAVFEEERDESQLKLILCGSMVAQMEALQSERSPLHGRLRAVHLRPLPFEEGSLFLPDLAPLDRFERYAIAGGMPRYLTELSGVDRRDAICRHVLDRNGPLWDEARTILEQELREPKVYFAILAELAGGDKDFGEIGSRTRLASSVTSKYLNVLERMRIVRRRLPLGADRGARGGHWRLEDPFFRFWFRFVFPYQDDLENGLRAEDLYDGEVLPALPEHVAPAFEEWCRDWVRARYGGQAQQVAAWWGPSLNSLRRSQQRSTEEIDIVGVSRGRVTLVGEVKWQNRTLDAGVLGDLEDYKIPALGQAAFRLADNFKIILLAKAGYSDGLRQKAEEAGNVVLVDVAAALDPSLE